jgi:hypothetical protein
MLDGMDHRSSIGAGINAGLAPHTPQGICDYSLGFRDTLPGPGWTDIDTGCIGTVLTDNGHGDGNLSPCFDLDPGEGRGGHAFMREATDHFTGLAARTKIGKNRNSAHFIVSIP